MRTTRRRLVPHRRRREQKTDFRQRLALLSSPLPRLVIRRSLNNILCQIIRYEKAGDKVLLFAHSGELKTFGWTTTTGNLSAAYLTGLLCSTKAKKAGISSAVLDTGLARSTKGSRLYAALKGCVDGGLQVPHSEEILPSDDRIAGKHIEAYATALKADKETYEKTFSAYLKAKVAPETISSQFSAAKAKMLKG